MPISKENINMLFDVMKFYDEQCNQIADNCYDDITRALKEICQNELKSANLQVFPFGSYKLKSNYQLVEPMEFYCIMPAQRDVVLTRESQQKKANKKKSTIKSIYQNVLQNDSTQTAFDVANKICDSLKNYVDKNDSVYCKNNVIYLKFNIQREASQGNQNMDENGRQLQLSVIIYVAYDFDKNGEVEFSKLGYKQRQNPQKILDAICKKNMETNGNYILFAKLVKMLELELIFANKTNIYLSDKTLFTEYVLYNVPNRFFEGQDFSEMFKQVANYLLQCDISDIFVPGTENLMFSKNGYYANSMFLSFVKKIAYICKNTDEMLKDILQDEGAENYQSPDNAEKNSTMQTESSNDKGKKDIKKINKKF